jgi:hypothetical protein
MGEPNGLAQFIGSEFRKQYFTQRHPILMFAVTPVLLVLAIWAGLQAGLMLLDHVLGGLLGEPGESVATVLSLTDQLIIYAEIWVPVALTTAIFCRAARRRRMSWRWPMLTAATLAVFPGMTVRLTPIRDWVLVIGVPPAITAALLLQSLLPLAIGGWYSWRRFRLERAADLDIWLSALARCRE